MQASSNPGVSRDEQYVELPARVIEVLPAGMFRVQLAQNVPPVLVYLGGRLRRNRIRVVLGDRVMVAVSAYDPRRGRIIHRN